MNLLIFIHSLASGGAERVTVNLANYWAEKGWRVTVVTLAAKSLDFYPIHPMVQRIALDLVHETASLAAGLMHNLRRILALRRVLRKTQPDIALAMMTNANILLAFATLGLGIRAIGSERVHPPRYPLSWSWEWLRRRTYGRLYGVATLTRETASWLEANTQVRLVAVIPNAVPWPLPEYDPKINPEVIVPNARKMLLAVGRLVEQKGFDRLLEVFDELAQFHMDWDLVMLGEGPQRGMLEQKIYMAGLAQRVFLPGTLGNVGEWYARADLFVMSSRFEGFPNTLLEALASGLPVVSVDCDTGPRDIIRHEVDGLLVAPEDSAGLEHALGRLMGDADLRARFSRRAIEVRQRFSMLRVADMWQTMFEGRENE